MAEHTKKVEGDRGQTGSRNRADPDVADTLFLVPFLMDGLDLRLGVSRRLQLPLSGQGRVFLTDEIQRP